MNIQNGIYGYWDKEKSQIVYIGQSYDIYKRHSQHMSSSHYNYQVINRIIQNNPDRYKLVIIKVQPSFSKQDRDILEKHYIEFYSTFTDNDKFNYSPGGDFNPSTLPEVRKKISKANSGKHLSEETKRKISESHLGKHHSEQTKRKMSLSNENSTGFRRVSLAHCSSCRSGKRYIYSYYNDDGKQIRITSVNLEKLKQKVLEKNLPWEKLN